MLSPPPEPPPETYKRRTVNKLWGGSAGVPAGFGQKSSLLVRALLVFYRQTVAGPTASMGSTKARRLRREGEMPEVLRPRRPSRAGSNRFLNLRPTGPPAVSPDLRIALKNLRAMP